MPTATTARGRVDKEPVNLEVHPDFTKISVNTPSGIKHEKVVSTDSFLNIIKSIDTAFNLPLFPRNCRKIVKKGNSVSLFLEYPETVIKEFHYFKDVLKDVVVPRAILHTRLSDSGDGTYKLTNAHFFAIKEDLLGTEDIPLYWWPFPNQSPNVDGNICWGSNDVVTQFKRGCQLWNMTSLYHIFFASVFNSDYGWNTSNGDFPKCLVGATGFPYERLRSMDMTLNDFITGYVQGDRARY